jgi:membrane protease subunit HflC
MNKPIAVGVGLLMLVLLLLFSTTYTVKFNEVAIKQTFGRTSDESVITTAGLHFRLPVFIDKVDKLDTRLQLVESPAEEITTKDGLQIVVRAYLLWRIDTTQTGTSEAGDPVHRGPLDFFNAFGTMDGAAQSLRGQFRTEFTGALGEYTFGDLIGRESRLADAELSIKNALAPTLASRGVEARAVGISQISLPPKTSSAVLKRMEATRNVLAEGEREIGAAEAESIRGAGNRQADKIMAFAALRAEQIRAEGQREAQKYLDQMGEDEDLAIFLVWLDTLERTLFRNTTVILPTTGFAPYHLLNPSGVAFEGAIPQPMAGATPELAEVEEASALKAAAEEEVARRRDEGGH